MRNTHSSWIELSNKLEKITAQYGSSFYDKETDKTLDVGQALCRTIYGSDWQNNEQFKEADNTASHLPAPYDAMKAAESWANGNIPDWLQESA